MSFEMTLWNVKAGFVGSTIERHGKRKGWNMFPWKSQLEDARNQQEIRNLPTMISGKTCEFVESYQIYATLMVWDLGTSTPRDRMSSSMARYSVWSFPLMASCWSFTKLTCECVLNIFRLTDCDLTGSNRMNCWTQTQFKELFIQFSSLLYIRELTVWHPSLISIMV